MTYLFPVVFDAEGGGQTAGVVYGLKLIEEVTTGQYIHGEQAWSGKAREDNLDKDINDRVTDEKKNKKMAV